MPETPTELHHLGILHIPMPNEQLQKIIINYQQRAEQYIQKTIDMLMPVLQGREPIVLCDRGIGDGRAYMDHNAFDILLKNVGFSQGMTDIF